MSIVPSEIEFQSDSDDAAPSTRISGITVFFMLGLLAAGFATVGYLAMDELSGNAPRLAHSQGAAEPVDTDAVAINDEMAPGDVAQEDTAPIDPPPDETPPETAPEESILDDAAEFVIAEAPQGNVTGPAEITPSIKPPTVAYDPAVFDDMAPATGASDVESQPETPSEAPAPIADAPAEPADPAPPEASAPAETPADDPPATPKPQIDVSEPADTSPLPAPATPTPAPQPDPTVEPATAENIDPLSGSHVVQLASYRSDEEAMADWARIEARLGGYLDGKTYQVQRADLGDRGIYFRLRIGPFASSDTAQAFCAGLKERGQDCLALRR